jgi:hypothetical protein
MKRYIYPLIMMIIISTFISCEDPEAIRLPEIIDAANMRIQLDPEFTSLKADDLENAKIVFSLFSENTNLEEMELSVTYYNFQQDSNYSRRTIRVYKQADFDATNGAIRDVTFTSDELAELFGITVEDMGGGDRFDFFNVTSLTNGMVFPDTVNLPGGDVVNVQPNIINSALTTSFSVGWTSYVACPIDPTIYTGDYYLEQTAGPDDPFFGEPVRFAPMVVNITALSPIERSFQCTYLTFEDIEFRFLLICDNVLINYTSSLACSIGLRWANQSPPGPYNPDDDSELIILELENMDADCGVAQAEPLTLTLTKVE